MTKSDLVRRMRGAGLLPREASAAAQIAVQMHRRDRDVLILSAVRAGLSVRMVATVFGLTHPRVVQLVNRARGDLPTQSHTLHATEER